MSWTEWFHMVTSARDMRIKALLSAYLFMWTCNRAIRILGEGTVAEKVQVLTNSNKGISVIWKAQLQNRLGCAYRSIRNIVEDGGNVEWKKVHFTSFVALQRIAHGFEFDVEDDTPHIKTRIMEIKVAAKRVRQYVESFGIDFDARINRQLIQRKIAEKIGS